MVHTGLALRASMLRTGAIIGPLQGLSATACMFDLDLSLSGSACPEAPQQYNGTWAANKGHLELWSDMHVAMALTCMSAQVSQQNIADFPSYGMACQMKVRLCAAPFTSLSCLVVMLNFHHSDTLRKALQAYVHMRLACISKGSQ